MKNLLLLLSLSILLVSCSALTGEEVGRLKINEVSTEQNLIVKETILKLKKDDELAIWSDMDLEYDGDVALRFRMDVLKDGESFGNIEFDPFEKNITIGEIKTDLMGDVNWSFTGKNAELKIEEDAEYTFKAILVASDNPSLVVNKAELVLKK